MVRLGTQQINEIIDNQGYEVTHNKVILCPCHTISSISSNDCVSCNGSKYAYLEDSVVTKMMISNLDIKKEYSTYGRIISGTINITCKAIDKVSYRDSIIINNVSSIYNEIREVKDRKVQLIYSVKEIIHIYRFITDSVKLELIESEDYSIDATSKIITISNDDISDNTMLSIKYYHYPTYYIQDVMRDISYLKDKDFNTFDERSEFPMSAIAVRAHSIDNNSGGYIEN